MLCSACQIHQWRHSSPETPELVPEGLGLKLPAECHLAWWGYLILIHQGNPGSLTSCLLYLSPSWSPVFSTQNPVWFPYLIFSPKEFGKTELAIFFPLLSLPLVLPYFHSQVLFGPALVLCYLQRKTTQKMVPLERIQIGRFEGTALPKPKLENWSKQLLKKLAY